MTLMSSQKDKRIDPLVHFPQEILSVIFDKLLIRDAIECVRVCKAWYNRVPGLSRTPWKKMLLDCKKQNELPSCPPIFNDYIQSIAFFNYDDDVNTLFNHLNLIISWDCPQLTKLSFFESKVGEQNEFIDILECLGYRLQVLVFQEHPSNLSFHSILNTCPKLRFLHYQVSMEHGFDVDKDSELDRDILSNHHHASRLFEELTCLSLDCVIPNDRMERILKRCPNLRCVRIGNMDKYSHHDPYNYAPETTEKETNLSNIIRYCPKVEYIECNRTDDAGDDEEEEQKGDLNDLSYIIVDKIAWWAKYANKDRSSFHHLGTGLRVLKFFGVEGSMEEDYHFSDLASILRSSQDTLEVLHLANCELAHHLDDLSMNNLREFACKNEVCSAAPQEFIRFISRCKKLTNISLDANLDLLNHSSSSVLLANTLVDLPTLSTLGFRTQYKNPYWPDQRNSDEISFNISRFLHILGSRSSCHLEHISFGTPNQAFEILSNSILGALTQIPSLRTIQLHNEGTISDSDSEFDFTDVDEDEDGDDEEEEEGGGGGQQGNSEDALTEQGLINFVSGLQRNTPRIEQIWFREMKLLSLEVFKALGEMHSLRILRITDCSAMNQKKMKYLLSSRTTDETCFKTLSIEGPYHQTWDGEMKECLDLLRKHHYRFRCTPTKDESDIYCFKHVSTIS